MPQSPKRLTQPTCGEVDPVPDVRWQEPPATKSRPNNRSVEIERLSERLNKICRVLPIKPERRALSEVSQFRSFDELANFHARQAHAIGGEVHELSDAAKARHKFSEENRERFDSASMWGTSDQALMGDIIRGDEGVDVIGAARAMAREVSGRELVLEALKDRGLGSVAILAELVAEGVPGAAGALVTLVRESVQFLNQATTRCPSAIRQVARKEAVWASLRSPHPHTEKIAAEDFNALQVGRENLVLIDPSARSLLSDPLGRVTLQLIEHLETARQTTSRLAELGVRTEQWSKRKWLLLASKLPRFSKDTALTDWFEAVKALLECHQARYFPSEGNRVEYDLTTLVTSKSHRKSPGKIRARVIEKIRVKLGRLAPKHAE